MADQNKSWTTRNYILAALGGTLAATAIVVIVSLVLSPAHITFSVARASRSSADSNVTQILNLTIAAENGSWRRAAVRYQSVFVDLKNTSSGAGKNTIHAEVYARPNGTKYLASEPVNISASALLVPGGVTEDFFGGRASSGKLTVVVTAQVRFKVGPARTRLYDIMVACPGVLFPVERPYAAQETVPCSG